MVFLLALRGGLLGNFNFVISFHDILFVVSSPLFGLSIAVRSRHDYPQFRILRCPDKARGDDWTVKTVWEVSFVSICFVIVHYFSPCANI